MVTDKLVENAKSVDNFTNFVNKGTSALKGWAAKNLTFSKSLELLEQASKQAIDELNKATAVGLQDSFATIGYEAVRLKMSFDEFSEVISKNRDVVRQLGGGTEGIKTFTNLLHEASKGLDYMGRDGVKATSRFTETLKTMGVTAKDTETFGSAMKKTQKEFTKFSYIYGDSYDQFADLMESQMMGTAIQTKLTGLNKIQAAQLRDEVMLRTENLKNLGMTNGQIKEFGDRVDAAFDPKKNEQHQKIIQAEMFKAQVSQLQQMQPENKDLQAATAALQQYAEMVEGGATPDQIEKFMSENVLAFKTYGAALDKNNQKQSALFNEGRKGDALMFQYAANQLGTMGGTVADVAKSFGGTALLAAKKGLATTPEDAAKMGKKAEDLTTNQDAYTKTVMFARDIQQQYNSIMQSSITTGLLGFGAGLGAAIIALGKFNLSLLKNGGGGGFDLGKASGGLGKIFKIAASLGAVVDVGMGLKDLMGGKEQTEMPTGLDMLSPMSWGMYGGNLINKGAETALGGKSLGAAAYDLFNPTAPTALAAGTTPTAINQPISTATAAPTHTAAPTVSAAAQAPTGNPSLDELRKQTTILAMIAQNTSVSFKPQMDKSMYKGSPTEVANNMHS